MRIGRVRRWMWPCLGLICVASLSINLAVIVQNQTDDIDGPMHMERVGRLLARAAAGDKVAWNAFVEAASGSVYPMFMHYATLPVRLIVGDEAQAGAVGVAVFNLIAILSAFGLAHLMGGDRAGLLAAVFTALIPGLYRFCRMEMVDTPLAAAVALTMLALFMSDGLTHRGWSLLFGLACGIGLLLKQSFPLYIAVPALYLVAQGAATDKPESRAKRLKNLTAAAGIMGVVFLWYCLPDLLDWLRRRSAARVYTVQLEKPSMHDFALLLFSDGLGPTLSIITLLCVLALPKRDHGVRALLIWILAPLTFVHVVFPQLSTRYLAPILPPAAVLMGLGLDHIAVNLRKWLSGLVIGAAVLAAVGAAAYDQLKPDRTAYTFQSYQQRLLLSGIPQPRRLGWDVTPVVRSLEKSAYGKRIILLFNTPFSSLVQSGIWRWDPMAEVVNLFETAALGQAPPEFEDQKNLESYLASADFLLVKTGFQRRADLYDYSQTVSSDFAHEVFNAFFAVKSQFELIEHFPYPEDVGPVLLYQKIKEVQK